MLNVSGTGAICFYSNVETYCILSTVYDRLNALLCRDISKRAHCHPGGPEDVPQEEKEEA